MGNRVKCNAHRDKSYLVSGLVGPVVPPCVCCGAFALARAAAAAASQAATAAFAPSMRRGAQGLASVTA